jgi:hypothetical protein
VMTTVGLLVLALRVLPEQVRDPLKVERNPSEKSKDEARASGAACTRVRTNEAAGGER